MFGRKVVLYGRGCRKDGDVVEGVLIFVGIGAWEGRHRRGGVT